MLVLHQQDFQKKMCGIIKNVASETKQNKLWNVILVIYKLAILSMFFLHSNDLTS